jgi:hypothetical protein
MEMAIGRGGDVGMGDWIRGDMLGGLRKGRNQAMYASIRERSLTMEEGHDSCNRKQQGNRFHEVKCIHGWVVYC